MGPIRLSFAGRACVERDVEQRSLRAIAAGSDRSGSTVRADMTMSRRRRAAVAHPSRLMQSCSCPAAPPSSGARSPGTSAAGCSRSSARASRRRCGPGGLSSRCGWADSRLSGRSYACASRTWRGEGTRPPPGAAVQSASRRPPRWRVRRQPPSGPGWGSPSDPVERRSSPGPPACPGRGRRYETVASV